MKLIRRIFHIFVFLALLSGIAVFYAVKVEPYRLVVKTFPLEKISSEKVSSKTTPEAATAAAPKTTGGTGKETSSIESEQAGLCKEITIALVSDIQISPTYDESRLMELVARINAQNPDIFLFTGDLYDNYAKYGPEEEVIAALSAIHAPLGKFAIHGNRDCGGGSIRRYSSILEASGIRLLTNEAAAITVEDGGTILIGGVDDYLLGSPDAAPILASMRETDSYRILMTHEPDTADSYANDGFDLILAGHSHGGQVSIPLIGGPETAMAHKYKRGFYQLKSDSHTELYVNPGIGTSHYPVRFMVPPEITVFQLSLPAQ